MMQAKIAIALILSILWFSAGWTISSWHGNAGYTKTLQAALEKQKEDMQIANDAAIALERTKAASETKTKVITKRVEVYLEGKPPSQCFDAEALKIFNEVS